MIRSCDFNIGHDQFPCFWHGKCRNVRASNMIFCLPAALHSLLKWQPIWIYPGYTCVYRNFFAASQSKRISLERKKTCSERKSWRWSVIVEESQRTYIARKALLRALFCCRSLVVPKNWAEKKVKWKAERDKSRQETVDPMSLIRLSLIYRSLLWSRPIVLK